MSSKPFDNRLLIGLKAKNSENTTQSLPFDGISVSTNDYIRGVQDLRNDFKNRIAKIANQTDKNKAEKELGDLIDAQLTKINELSDGDSFKVQNALMNPYAAIRLRGAIRNGESFITDSSSRRPWYEEDITGSNYDNGFSKYPTTSKLIEWGNGDSMGRTPYQFQDFVFSKWWNKIPNNRLITLRRYAMPVMDNMDSIYKPESTSNDTDNMFPPIATAITYFGDDTGNSLKDILKFSTGVNWGEAKADVWDVTVSSDGDEISTNGVLSGAGSAFGLDKIFGVSAKALNGLSILNNDIDPVGLAKANGLPPDPYLNGPYENRIKGPVNRIDTVKKRDAGIKFEMSGLKLKFDYVARPIGGINSKAVLLDILSNFMIMGSASAIFFGGAHRFRMIGTNFPASSQESIRKLYSGDLTGGINSMFKTFTNAFEGSYDGDSFIGMLAETAKGLLSDLLGAMGNPFGAKVEDTNNSSARTAKEGIKNTIIEKMQGGMKYPYLQNMRALLIGEPVGEWHVTIGNPMNPIAMIGNLICTNIEVEFNEEDGLGPDDFPLGFTVTVSLDHGMPRDRDAIESMFNRGGGRIYVLSDDIKLSADGQTAVDNATKNGDTSIPSAKAYITTQANTAGAELENPMSGNSNMINMNRGVLDTSNLGTLNFNDTNTLGSRIPQFNDVGWIRNKALK